MRGARLQVVIRRLPADTDEPACPFVVGETYQRKLRGLEGRPTFRVLATPVRQRLGEVTHRDAQAEGFAGRRALTDWRIDWVLRNDRRWAVAVAARHDLRTASDADVLERWRMRHASSDCWVLVIALIEAPRLLPQQREVLAEVARRGKEIAKGRRSDGGDGDEYTSGRTIDREAEAVDEATLTRIVAGELRVRAEEQLTRRERRALRGRTLFRSET